MFEELGIDQSFKTDTNLSAKQYFLVKSDDDAGTVVLCGDHEAAIGVLQNNPPTGTVAVVRCASGVKTKVIGATGIDVGEILGCDPSGRAEPFTYASDGSTAVYMVGIALTASAFIGGEITMLTMFAPSSE